MMTYRSRLPDLFTSLLEEILVIELCVSIRLLVIGRPSWVQWRERAAFLLDFPDLCPAAGTDHCIDVRPLCMCGEEFVACG